jgi:predicted deacetylase
VTEIVEVVLRRRALMPLLVVSVHDVAAATAAATRTWADALAGCGIPLTFLVVPGPWRGAELGLDDEGRALAAWLRSRQELGDEMSVHGWLHRADVRGRLPRRAVGTMVARGCAELWTTDRGLAAARTTEGLEVLRRNGLTAIGSTPPGWLSSRPARAGLADAGLQYVTDHAGLVDLTTGRRWWAPALCHRPATVPVPNPATAQGGTPSGTAGSTPGGTASGTAGSTPDGTPGGTASGTAGSTPGGTAAALERVGRRVVGSAARLVGAGRSVRIGLHPDDLNRPGLLESTVEAVRRCLTEGAQATTYAAVLQQLRART